MNKVKIAFLCHFSNPFVREYLDLRKMKIRKFLLRLRRIPDMIYDDFAIWVSDYIEEFEKHEECEFHIIAPHFGMKRKYQNFDINGIHYHFWGYKDSIIHSVHNRLTNIDKKSDYSYNRNKMQNIVNSINPDIVCLCGAENPYYSIGVLDIKDKQIYVILQTLLNDPKRIEMGVGDDYRREIEKKIFQHVGYFCTQDPQAMDFINNVKPQATILPARFPTHRPEIDTPDEKTSDFVFFARTITVNKGIEDVLQAYSIVKKRINNVKLSVIGSIEKEYKQILVKLIEELDIKDNVIYKGYYQDVKDTYREVLKSKVVVIPGITAGLNSTVRESMFMSMPVVCYDTEATSVINKEKKCLFVAKMRDIQDLANQMILTLENKTLRVEIAKNGKKYAEKFFGNKAVVNKFLDNCRQIIEGRV